MISYSLKLWQAVDDLIHHIVHSVNPENLNSLQADMPRLPDQLSLALQCVLSYEKTLSAKHVGFEETTTGKCVENIERKKLWTKMSMKRCSSGNDSTSKTDGKSDNSNTSNCSEGVSQNVTVTSQGNNVTSRMEASGPSEGSGTIEETVIIKQNFCSPTDITFFSNKIVDSSDISPTSNISDNCNKQKGTVCFGSVAVVAGASNHSNQLHSNCNHGKDNSSISSELSKQGSTDKTFNIFPDNSKPGVNINIPECKAYDQNKVGTKLSTWSETLKVDALKIRVLTDKENYGNKKCSSDHHDFFDTEFRRRKLSNKIEKETGPVPNKLLTSFKWITLDDDRLGK